VNHTETCPDRAAPFEVRADQADNASALPIDARHRGAAAPEDDATRAHGGVVEDTPEDPDADLARLHDEYHARHVAGSELPAAPNGQVPGTVHEAARFYAQHGLRPVPLPHESSKPGKRPVLERWTELCYVSPKPTYPRDSRKTRR
jgi:hypothetical protein